MRGVLAGIMLTAGADVSAQIPAPAPTAAKATVAPVTTPAPAAAAPAVTPLVGGPNFISPAGEPFRSQDKLSGAEHWFEQADANHDGKITPAEFRADFDRFFAILDTDHDGVIGPDEIEHYESEVAPEIKVASTYGDPNLAKSDDDGNVTPPPYPTRLGAGRFGYLDMPEPIVSADANFDRGITRAEMDAAAAKRFAMLDTAGAGVITRDELPKLGSTRGDSGVGNPTNGAHHHRGGGGGGHHGGGGFGGGGFGG